MTEPRTERIRQFVLKRFPLAAKKKIQSTDDLLGSGVVDSMGVLDIVTYLENEFSIVMTDEDLTPNNFRDIEAIARLVEAKANVRA